MYYRNHTHTVRLLTNAFYTLTRFCENRIHLLFFNINNVTRTQCAIIRVVYNLPLSIWEGKIYKITSQVLINSLQ